MGANLRRIEAVTSYGALEYLDRVEAELRETAEELRVPLFDVSERTAANLRTLKDLQQKHKRNKGMVAEDGITKLVSAAVDAKAGYPVIVACMTVGEGEAAVDAGGLRAAWDVLRARLGRPGAVVLASEKEGKPIVLAAGTPEAVDAGFDANALIKAMASHIKGGGGGKPAMAQAGGKDASGIDAALDAARALLL